jgi:hypothetical protein
MQTSAMVLGVLPLHIDNPKFTPRLWCSFLLDADRLFVLFCVAGRWRNRKISLQIFYSE